MASGVGGYVGALNIDTVSNITLDGCVFTDNGGAGGAVTIYISSGGTATIVNNIFSGNWTSSGMGSLQMETAGGTATVTNNTFVGNRSSFGGPGGVGFYASQSGDVINMYNNIVWGANTAEGRVEVNGQPERDPLPTASTFPPTIPTRTR